MEKLSPSNTQAMLSLPLFRGLDEADTDVLLSAFEATEVSKGATLFNAGENADSMYVLKSGQVTLTKQSTGESITLSPPVVIGELGTLCELQRLNTAVVTEDSTVFRASKISLEGVIAQNPELGLRFYQHLVRVTADKIGRDQRRLEDMRTNLMSTQKSMKTMRDFLLESEDTPVSERIHGIIDGIIKNNRRANYRVAPPSSLPALVKIGNELAQVSQISRTHVSLIKSSGELPKDGASITGVLALSGPEIPVGGKVLRTIGKRIDIELDLLIEEYTAILEGYLTRVQLLDILV